MLGSVPLSLVFALLCLFSLSISLQTVPFVFRLDLVFVVILEATLPIVSRFIFSSLYFPPPDLSLWKTPTMQSPSVSFQLKSFWAFLFDLLLIFLGEIDHVSKRSERKTMACSTSVDNLLLVVCTCVYIFIYLQKFFTFV